MKIFIIKICLILLKKLLPFKTSDSFNLVNLWFYEDGTTEIDSTDLKNSLTFKI